MRTKHRHWIFRALHDLLEPLVLSPASNLIIANFQHSCGISRVGKVHNKFLYYFFKTASYLGEDMAYFPLMYWFFFEVGISFGTNFLFLLLAGQIVKDLIHLPRPPTTFVHNGKAYSIAKLEHHFGTEYGFPSTHTLSGMLPLALILAAYRRNYMTDPWITYCSVCAGVIFCACVAFSRLYVGVHSVCDLCGGLTIGIMLICLLHFGGLGDLFDELVYKHSYGIAITICIGISFVNAYPRPVPWRASFGTASLIVGIWTGISLSLWYLFNVNQTLLAVLQSSSAETQVLLNSWLSSQTLPSIDFVIHSVSKVLVGGVAVGVTHPVTKQLAHFMFLTFRRWGLTSRIQEEEIGVDVEPVQEDQLYWVQVPARMLYGTCMSISLLVLTPYLWTIVGLA